MTLVEFLRQWQRGRLTVAVLASVLLHALLFVVLMEVHPRHAGLGTKRGDALIVELPKDSEPAAAGAPGVPAPRPATPSAATPPPSAGKASVKPASRAEVSAPPPRPTPTAKSAPPPPEPERRVAAAPSPPPASSPPAAKPPPAADASGKPEARGPESARPSDAASKPDASPERQVASAASEATSSGRAFVPDIRSLRGTGGVHGGGGEGRGGVEGDPVSLDNPDPRYADYLLRVKRQIEEKMTYPCVKDPTTRSCDYKSAQLVLEFGIRKDGELAFVQLRDAATDPVFDDVSANAIKLASPFPPLPDAIRRLHPTGLPISAHFRYEFTQSFRSFIR